MTDESINREKEKLQKAINAYLSHVALANPERLPTAMIEAMYLVMSFKIQGSITEFTNAFINKIGGKGR